MGLRYDIWNRLSSDKQISSYDQIIGIVKENRNFHPQAKLSYKDDPIDQASSLICEHIIEGKKIALYSDYDVDGVMSCASWIWFFKAIGFSNYIFYIPDRFQEGYGINKEAISNLVCDQHVDLIVSMDTGITAKQEVDLCKSLGANFVCTDHHNVQKDLLPDCIVVNPKLYSDPYYKDLCGCGVCFILLRHLALKLQAKDPSRSEYHLSLSQWKDILALVGIATICDIVPLNGANHSLAKMGLDALSTSSRDILVKLKEICSLRDNLDEKDVGFSIGPRINAVGRLEHASKIVSAFQEENYDEIVSIIDYMNKCNNRRKKIQDDILTAVQSKISSSESDDFFFIGGTGWHHGVIGIVASKLMGSYFKPTFIYSCENDICTGSVRSIPGIDLTSAFECVKDLLIKCGGHSQAGGFSFNIKDSSTIYQRLSSYFKDLRSKHPDLWKSKVDVDCRLHYGVIDSKLSRLISDLKPFGHSFLEPVFELRGVLDRIEYLNDKKTGNKKHSILYLKNEFGFTQRILFFNWVLDLLERSKLKVLVNIQENEYRGVRTCACYGVDVEMDLD